MNIINVLIDPKSTTTSEKAKIWMGPNSQQGKLCYQQE